jgi:hypothetical protein
MEFRDEWKAFFIKIGRIVIIAKRCRAKGKANNVRQIKDKINLTSRFNDSKSWTSENVSKIQIQAVMVRVIQ